LNSKKSRKIHWADERNGGKLVTFIGVNGVNGRNATPLKKDIQAKPILREDP